MFVHLSFIHNLLSISIQLYIQPSLNIALRCCPLFKKKSVLFHMINYEKSYCNPIYNIILLFMIIDFINKRIRIEHYIISDACNVKLLCR